jgi:hypothetical protein
MGGHNGWRKRVKNGLLAKEGGGGNIVRHRPRFGRQGIIIVPKRGDSNPKRKTRILSKEIVEGSCKCSVSTDRNDLLGISFSFKFIAFLGVLILLLVVLLFHHIFRSHQR